MDLKVTVDFPNGKRGMGFGDGVQMRTPVEGEAIHIERVLDRNNLSYERCLELIGKVEGFLVSLGKEFEVSKAEAEEAHLSEVHAATVVEIARRKADEHLNKK